MEKGFAVRLSASVDQYVAAMAKARGATEAVGASSVKNFEKLGTSMSQIGGKLTRSVTLPVIAAGAGMVAASLSWESSFAGVAKTVDMSAAGLQRLEGQLRAMARSMPATHGEIAAVAEAAGQLGVQADNIADFTKVMVELGATTNLSSEEAATSIAQMANIMGTAPRDIERLGAALVDLGNNGASTERDIIQMAQRIAGAGDVIGLSEADVLGFANALASAGIEADAGGTAISTTMISIAKAVQTGGESLDSFASVAGMSSTAFAAAFREDAAGAITQFIAGLGGISEAGGNVFGVMDQLGLSDARVSRALLSMAGAGDLLRNSLDLGTQAWNDNTALQEEYAKRADTSASKLAVLRNQIVDVAIDLGNQMVPVLLDVVGGVASLVKWFGNLPAPVKDVALGLLAVTAAAGPLLMVGGSLVRNFMLIQSTFKKLTDTMSMNPWLIAAGAAVAAIGILTAAGGDQSQVQQEMEMRAQDVATALDTEIDQIVRLGVESGQAVDPVKFLADAQGALSKALIAGDDVDDLTKALGALGFTTQDTAEVFRMLNGMKLSPSGGVVEGWYALTRATLEAKGISEDVAHVLADTASEVLTTGGVWDITSEATRGWTTEQLALFDAMKLIAGQVDKTDMNKVAADYLNAQVAAGGLTAELVTQAEALTGVSRNGDTSTAVYEKYLELLSQLTPEQQALAAGVKETTTAVEQNTPALVDQEEQLKRQKAALDAVKKALADSRNEFQRLADEAGVLEQALSDVFGGPADLEQAQRNYQAGLHDLRDAFKENGRTLDMSTEKGRANREEIEKQLDAIADWGVAMVKNGTSTEDAANAVNFLTEDLVKQMVQAGFTEDAARAYIEQLGRTPEDVTTALQLVGDEKMKADLQDRLDQLDSIDEGAAAKIEALIDAGSFDEARRMLDDLTGTRDVNVTVHSSGRHFVSAAGRFVPAGSNMLTTVGERGPEVILPLDDPARMRALMSDPRVSGPMARLFGAGEPGPGQGAKTGAASSVGAANDWNAYEQSHLLDQYVVQPPAPSTTEATSEDDVMENRYKRHDLSAADYDAYLAHKQEGLVKYSDEEEAVFERRQQLAEDEKRANDDRIEEEREVMRFKLDSGEITLREYREYLKGQFESTDAYSADHRKIWGELHDVELDIAEEQQAKIDAMRDAAEKAEKARLDRIEDAYEKAGERRSAADASRAADEAMSDLSAAAATAEWYAHDRKATDQERADANADLERAKERAAQALYERADANANNAGIEDKTPEWSAAVRAALLADEQNAPALAPYIDRILDGIPTFAAGGYVPATVGGQVIRVAEAGRGEWVMDDPKLQGLLTAAASQAYHPAGPGAMAAPSVAIGDTVVRVFIGNEEISRIARIEIDRADRESDARLLAGVR